MAKVFLGALLAFFLLGASFYGLTVFKPHQIQPTLSVSSPSPTIAPTPIPGLYRDSVLNIELHFPTTWDGFTVTHGTYPGDATVNFAFASGHQPFNIFSIYRFTLEQWNNLKGKSSLTKISQSSQYVFVCDGCCTAKGDKTGGGQFDSFQRDRCGEVPVILQSFKTISSTP